MNEITVQEKNGQVVVSSRDVAEKFGKRHADVVRAIDIKIEVNAILRSPKYVLSMKYLDKSNRQSKEYLMTRDGFSFLVMGFNGKDADIWKIKYIEAFNQMEERLKNGNQLTEEERLKLQLFSKDASEVAYAHNRLVELATAPLHQQLEKQQPKVELAETMLTSKNAISVSDFAKMTYSKFKLGSNNMFRALRDTGFLLENNTPYQKYINAGYFRVIEVPVTIGYQKYLLPKTLITPKGQEYLFKKLSEVLLRY